MQFGGVQNSFYPRINPMTSTHVESSNTPLLSQLMKLGVRISPSLNACLMKNSPVELTHQNPGSVIQELISIVRDQVPSRIPLAARQSVKQAILDFLIKNGANDPAFPYAHLMVLAQLILADPRDRAFNTHLSDAVKKGILKAKSNGIVLKFFNGNAVSGESIYYWTHVLTPDQRELLNKSGLMDSIYTFLSSDLNIRRNFDPHNRLFFPDHTWLQCILMECNSIPQSADAPLAQRYRDHLARWMIGTLNFVSPRHREAWFGPISDDPVLLRCLSVLGETNGLNPEFLGRIRSSLGADPEPVPVPPPPAAASVDPLQVLGFAESFREEFDRRLQVEHGRFEATLAEQQQLIDSQQEAIRSQEGRLAEQAAVLEAQEAQLVTQRESLDAQVKLTAARDAEIQRLQDLLRGKESGEATLRAENQALQDRVGSQGDQLADSSARVHALEGDLDAREQTIASLQSDSRTQEETIAKLRLDLAQSDQDHDAQIAQLRDQFQTDLRSQSQQLQAEYQQALETERGQLATQFRDQMTAFEGAIAERIGATSQEIESRYVQQVAELEAAQRRALSERDQQLAGLKAENETLRGSISRTEEEFNEKSARLAADFVAERAQLEGEISHLRESAAAVALKTVDQAGETSAKGSGVPASPQLEARVSELEGKLAQREAALQRLESDYSERFRQQDEDYRKRLADLEAQLTQQDQEMAEMVQTFEQRSRTEAAAFLEQKADLAEQLQRLQTSQLKLEHDLSEKTLAFQDEVREIQDQHTHAIESLQSQQADALTSQAGAFEARFAELEQTHARALSELTERQLTALAGKDSDRAAALADQSSQLERQYQKQVAVLSEEKDSAMGAIQARFSSQLSELQSSSRADVERVTRTAAAEQAALTAQISQFQAELDRLQSENSGLVQRNAELLAQFQVAEQEVHQRSSALTTELADRKAQLQDELAAFKAAIQSQTDTLGARYREDLAALQANHRLETGERDQRIRDLEARHAAQLGKLQLRLVQEEKTHREVLQGSAAESQRALVAERTVTAQLRSQADARDKLFKEQSLAMSVLAQQSAHQRDALACYKEKLRQGKALFEKQKAELATITQIAADHSAEIQDEITCLEQINPARAAELRTQYARFEAAKAQLARLQAEGAQQDAEFADIAFRSDALDHEIDGLSEEKRLALAAMAAVRAESDEKDLVRSALEHDLAALRLNIETLRQDLSALQSQIGKQISVLDPLSAEAIHLHKERDSLGQRRDELQQTLQGLQQAREQLATEIENLTAEAGAIRMQLLALPSALPAQFDAPFTTAETAIRDTSAQHTQLASDLQACSAKLIAARQKFAELEALARQAAERARQEALALAARSAPAPATPGIAAQSVLPPPPPPPYHSTPETVLVSTCFVMGYIPNALIRHTVKSEIERLFRLLKERPLAPEEWDLLAKGAYLLCKCVPPVLGDQRIGQEVFLRQLAIRKGFARGPFELNQMPAVFRQLYPVLNSTSVFNINVKLVLQKTYSPSELELNACGVFATLFPLEQPEVIHWETDPETRLLESGMDSALHRFSIPPLTESKFQSLNQQILYHLLKGRTVRSRPTKYQDDHKRMIEKLHALITQVDKSTDSVRLSSYRLFALLKEIIQSPLFKSGVLFNPPYPAFRMCNIVNGISLGNLSDMGMEMIERFFSLQEVPQEAIDVRYSLGSIPTINLNAETIQELQDQVSALESSFKTAVGSQEMDLYFLVNNLSTANISELAQRFNMDSERFLQAYIYPYLVLHRKQAYLRTHPEGGLSRFLKHPATADDLTLLFPTGATPEERTQFLLNVIREMTLPPEQGGRLSESVLSHEQIPMLKKFSSAVNDRKPMVLYGEAGSGKTFMSCLVPRFVTMSVPFVVHIAPSAPVDAESEHWELLQDLSQLQVPLTPGQPPRHFWITNTDLGLLLGDPAQRAHLNNPNVQDAMWVMDEHDDPGYLMGRDSIQNQLFTCNCKRQIWMSATANTMELEDRIRINEAKLQSGLVTEPSKRYHVERKLQELKEQLTRMHRDIELELESRHPILEPCSQSDVLGKILPSIVSPGNFLIEFPPEPSGRRLPPEDVLRDAMTQIRSRIPASIMVFKDSRGIRQVRMPGQTISYTQFLADYTRGQYHDRSIICLYTADSVGGDFDAFSRERVVGQYIVYSSVPTENALYQNLRRRRPNIAETTPIRIFYTGEPAIADMPAFRDRSKQLQAAASHQAEQQRIEMRLSIKKRQWLRQMLERILHEKLAPPPPQPGLLTPRSGPVMAPLVRRFPRDIAESVLQDPLIQSACLRKPLDAVLSEDILPHLQKYVDPMMKSISETRKPFEVDPQNCAFQKILALISVRLDQVDRTILSQFLRQEKDDQSAQVNLSCSNYVFRTFKPFLNAIRESEGTTFKEKFINYFLTKIPGIQRQNIEQLYTFIYPVRLGITLYDSESQYRRLFLNDPDLSVNDLPSVVFKVFQMVDDLKLRVDPLIREGFQQRESAIQEKLAALHKLASAGGSAVIRPTPQMQLFDHVLDIYHDISASFGTSVPPPLSPAYKTPPPPGGYVGAPFVQSVTDTPPRPVPPVNGVAAPLPVYSPMVGPVPTVAPSPPPPPPDSPMRVGPPSTTGLRTPRIIPRLNIPFSPTSPMAGPGSTTATPPVSDIGDGSPAPAPGLLGRHQLGGGGRGGRGRGGR